MSFSLSPWGPSDYISYTGESPLITGLFLVSASDFYFKEEPDITSADFFSLPVLLRELHFSVH
jgi:hypothetical protein